MGTIEEFIDQLSIGDIYWFENPTISSPDPHPHIYVGKEDENHLFLICCTSNFEGRLRHFEINELPFETLVRLQIRDGISLSELLEAETIERVLSQFPKDL